MTCSIDILSNPGNRSTDLLASHTLPLRSSHTSEFPLAGSTPKGAFTSSNPSRRMAMLARYSWPRADGCSRSICHRDRKYAFESSHVRMSNALLPATACSRAALTADVRRLSALRIMRGAGSVRRGSGRPSTTICVPASSRRAMAALRSRARRNGSNELRSASLPPMLINVRSGLSQTAAGT